MNPDPSQETNSEVIVIGAGIAGLAAARALQDEGYDVIVLEGRNRTGGRIWTSRLWKNENGIVPTTGAPVDLGASWIHGSQGNPITSLAREARAQTLATNYDNARLFNTDGNALSDREYDAIESAGEEILEEITDLGGGGADYSVLEALEEEVDLLELTPDERRRLDFYLNLTLEQELAADISELSARRTDDTEEFDGPDLIFSNGYGALVDVLVAGDGSGGNSGLLDVRLGQTVRQISYDAHGVRILTQTGEFQTRRAIITLPVGVLKAGKVTFLPDLPAEKRESLAGLGSGLLNKLYLRFPHPSWPKEPEFINYISRSKGEWCEWQNIYHYTNQPILLGFNAAQYARNLESLSDEETVLEALRVLHTLFGKSLPDPEAWQITRWAADPFALGSYSFNAVGGGRRARLNLARPIEERLFFAGEATSEDYPATVHGAFLSGLREAKRIGDLNR